MVSVVSVVSMVGVRGKWLWLDGDGDGSRVCVPG